VAANPESPKSVVVCRLIQEFVIAIRAAMVMLVSVAMIRTVIDPSLLSVLIVAGLFVMLVLFERFVLRPVAVREQSRPDDRYRRRPKPSRDVWWSVLTLAIVLVALLISWSQGRVLGSIVVGCGVVLAAFTLAARIYLARHASAVNETHDADHPAITRGPDSR
jgi:hypothetical protein